MSGGARALERARLTLEMYLEELEGIKEAGVTRREVVDALRGRFTVTEEIADHTAERMTFKLPRELVA